ncbi:unnamed protein product [Moneuplotes crassus]|uniref:Uncharacterized protein n=1 Tax=Euplotes crassus TaxID=5936 RepID=A0AAD1Y0F5_EUPCR|nr:unnamed protein product [Moneuplotes crassus]
MEEEANKKVAQNLTPNEKHFYWQELCDKEDYSRDNFDIKDKIEIYNSFKKKSAKRPKGDAFNENAGKLFTCVTNTTAMIKPSRGSGFDSKDYEYLEKYYKSGLKNLRFSNPGGARVLANSGMGETLSTQVPKEKSSKSSHKINKLEARIQHERKMRELAQKEVNRLKAEVHKLI